jgi:hypothetical protein
MNPFALGIVALVAAITACAGILSILLSAEVFQLASAMQYLATFAGKATLYAFGAFLLAISIHYASHFLRGRAQLAHFSQDGQLGRIELSPYALKELVSKIMQEEIGIDRFKAKLGHLGQALSIKITTTLTPEDRVAEIGQQIQDTLSRRVTERTGVEVGKVSVLVNSIQSQEQQFDTDEDEENEHTAAS